jgi:hypothetical protein
VLVVDETACRGREIVRLVSLRNISRHSARRLIA